MELAVDELPGVGWNICQKLKEVNISTVRGIRGSSKEALQRELGNKTGTPRPAILTPTCSRIALGLHSVPCLALEMPEVCISSGCCRTFRTMQ